MAAVCFKKHPVEGAVPQVDYRGEEVNVHIFLRVLIGALAVPGHSKPSLRCCCRTLLRTAFL